MNLQMKVVGNNFDLFRWNTEVLTEKHSASFQVSPLPFDRTVQRKSSDQDAKISSKITKTERQLDFSFRRRSSGVQISVPFSNEFLRRK